MLRKFRYFITVNVFVFQLYQNSEAINSLVSNSEKPIVTEIIWDVEVYFWITHLYLFGMCNFKFLTEMSGN